MSTIHGRQTAIGHKHSSHDSSPQARGSTVLVRIGFPWPAMIAITINSLVVHSAYGLGCCGFSLKTRGRRLTPQRTDKLLAICTSPRRAATNRPDRATRGQKYWTAATRATVPPRFIRLPGRKSHRAEWRRTGRPAGFRMYRVPWEIWTISLDRFV